MNEKALYKIFYGMYIVSSFDGEKLNGQIANTVFQLTAEPPLLGVSINKENLTHMLIEKSGIFTVSVLAKEAPMKFIGLFGFRSGRDIDKFKEVSYKIGLTGAPIVLDNTVAYMEAKVVNKVDCGTHTIFIGEVTEADILADKDPMTYAYYREVKNGKSPKTAPTYMKD
ncbi:flavin reductase [Thermosipho ferrireducens]|uniref:Flavin reductase n=1 Tax=Thermosipho ferrireducens TaxID=2571116 RepID=A0ABX7SAG2_9BACT|nr:flavin reductase family protein [Thermosipho ferrireducens]QTA38416.1 flavin reductase [Thermosipho ferrireducens]